MKLIYFCNLQKFREISRNFSEIQDSGINQFYEKKIPSEVLSTQNVCFDDFIPYKTQAHRIW